MKKQKNILVITPWFPSAFNPYEGTFVRDQVEILKKHFNTISADFSFTFTILHFLPTIDIPGMLFKKRHLERKTDFIENDIPVIHEQALILSHRLSLGKNYLVNKRHLKGWDKAIASIGNTPDLIIAITLTGLMQSMKILQQKSLTIPVVLHEHSNPVKMHIRSKEQYSTAIDALQKSSVILAAGNKSFEQIKELLPDKKVHIVWNSVHETFTSQKPILTDNRSMKLLTVGHLVPDKAHVTLIKATSLLAQNSYDKLTIIGEGPLREELTTLIQKLGLSEKVALVGAKSRSEIVKYMSDYDLFVFSSKTENCPVALAEAQSMGLPCVCTINGGSEKILLPGNGLAVAQDETGNNLKDGIAQAINTYNTFDRMKISESAQSTFSAENFSENFYNQIKSLI